MSRNPPLPLLSDSELVNILALSQNATAIYTSEDLIIQSANDAMLLFWNKGRDVIGEKLGEAVPELKDNPLLELLKNVWRNGIDYDAANIKTNIRVNGELQATYFDLNYKAITKPGGEVYCILHTARDVTDRVQKQEEVKALQQHTQNLNENLAGFNEELSATNEELAATNEELATTNEEYVVLNEEINATNEELHLINEELIKARNTLGLASDAAGLITWTAQLGTTDFIISGNGASLFEADKQRFTLASFLNRVADEHRDIVKNSINQSIKDKCRLDLEIQIKATEQLKLRWFKLNAIPYFDEDGLPSHLTGTMLDVTEQKEDDQRKSDFIAMVSHELKTPLTSLKAYVQMLAGRASKAGDRFSESALDKADAQVNKMTGLINGFLNISRLESGKINLDNQSFELEKLVKEIVEEGELTISSHRLIFNPTCKVTVTADRDKIGSVITNFISNAVKYSPNGTSITVECDIVSNTARVSVQDAGMGISQADIKKLFERYYRVKGKQTETISGFGIGLYLSAEIINRHGGKIWVESEADKGSIFYFSLPV